VGRLSLTIELVVLNGRCWATSGHLLSLYRQSFQQTADVSWPNCRPGWPKSLQPDGLQWKCSIRRVLLKTPWTIL